jgi:hypothetical protein
MQAVHYTTSHTVVTPVLFRLTENAYSTVITKNRPNLLGILTVSNNHPRASSFPGMPGVLKLHLKFIFLKFMELTEYNNIKEVLPPSPSSLSVAEAFVFHLRRNSRTAIFMSSLK